MLNYQKKGMMLNDQDIVLIILKMTKKLKFLRDNGTLSFRNEPSLPEKDATNNVRSWYYPANI